MDGLENQSGTTPTAIEALQAEIKGLRTMMAVALLMLIGLSACADYYLSRQTQGLNAEIGQLQMGADAFPQAAAGDFVKRLKDYSAAHADFAPIAAKYPNIFGTQQPSARITAPPAAPAPAPKK